MSKTPVETQIEVSTHTAALNFVTNQTITMFLKYVNQRGLDTAYLTRNRDILEDGIWTWLAGRHLEKAVLEVYRDDDDTLVERLDLPFAYTKPDEVDAETAQQLQEQDFESFHEVVLEHVQDLDAPPEDCRCRVIVSLQDNEDGQAPLPVDGWTKSSFRDTDHLSREDLGDWLDGGSIQSSASFWFSNTTEPEDT